jgi:hypothetical protein
MDQKSPLKVWLPSDFLEKRSLGRVAVDGQVAKRQQRWFNEPLFEAHEIEPGRGGTQPGSQRKGTPLPLRMGTSPEMTLRIFVIWVDRHATNPYPHK